MMKQFDIDKAIYEKYIVPTQHKKGYMIGIEFEIPILNMSQEKIDFSVIQKVVLALREAFHLKIEKRDDNGDIYCLSNQETGDTISFDYSYCNVEFSMGTVICMWHMNVSKHTINSWKKSLINIIIA